MYRIVISCICLLFSVALHAQIPYIDSKEVLTNGVELYKKGEYKKSLEEYRKVHECDTNYVTALYEQMLALMADSSFEQAKTVAYCGLKLPEADRREFLLSLAAVYDYLQKTDSALIIYDSVMKLFPNDNQPWYEEGILFFRKKEYDKSLAYFQRSLLMNPNHFWSHYMAGTVYALQGRLSEALIAFNVSLLETQSAEVARKSISLINSITEGTDEVAKLYRDKGEQYSHPLFDDIDQIVNSKLALNKDYKLKMSLTDNIFRQFQVVMEKLKYDPKDTNFVMQYYVPLLAELYSKDMFEPFVLLLYSGYGLTNVDDLAKNNSDVDKVKKIVFPYLNKIGGTRELMFTKREKMLSRYHYYPNDNLIVIGTTVLHDDGEILVGDVELLRNNHTLRSRGHYNDKGEKDGLWKDYYATGQLKAKVVYANNKQVDSSFSYYANGNLSMVTIRDKEGEAKEEYEYKYYGWLSAIRKKLTGKMMEERSYFANGQLELAETYNGSDAKDGSYTVYHSNGVHKKEFTYKDGKYVGPFKFFYDNGQASEVANYVDGKLDGPYMAYYESGQLKEQSTYENGKEEGPYEKYYEDGTLSEKGVYSKGKETEIYRYTPSGRLYGTLKLRDNVSYAIKYTDDDHVVYDKEDKNGMREYSLFNANGNKSVDMKINDKGFRNGLLTFYFSTGAKSEETNYKDGDLEGSSVSYFKNGKIREEENYVNDKRDGYYKSYYDNGVLKQEGWYKEGKLQGPWRYYYINGKLENERYFLNDNMEGQYKIYNINGSLTDKYLYDFGSVVGHVCYDTAGVETDSVYFTPGAYATHRVSYWKKKDMPVYMEYSTKYGDLVGASSSRYANGVMSFHYYYKEGFKDSLGEWYYPDGKVAGKGGYRKGSKIGKWEYYNEIGELVKEERYNKSGSLEGRVNNYACGILHVAYNFKNGEKDSAQIYYGENERIAFILYFKNGDYTGYTYEGKDGKLLPVIKAKNGTGVVTAYYSNGQKSGEVALEQNMINGALKVYYSDGKLAEERTCKGFSLEGPFRRYNPGGKLVYDVVYKDDEEMGPERSYDKDGNPVIVAAYYYGILNGPSIIIDPATKVAKTYYYNYGQLTSTTK